MKTPRELLDIPEGPSFTPRLWGIGALVTGIVVVGLVLVSRFTAIDLARDMQNWQEKLNLIAESRTADIDKWVSDNFKAQRALADNPSLQLYMTELQLQGDSKPKMQGDAPGGEASQKSYLRNLLVFTAQRAGFAAANNMASIPANVQQGSKSGLAIVGSHNDIIVSTVMQSASRDLMIEHAKEGAPGQEALIDIRKDKEGTPYIGFITPIFAIQGDHAPNAQIGRVVGMKVLDANLFSLLKHPGTTENSLEAILVRNDATTMEYLSPLQDGSDALSKTSAFAPAASAEAKLIENKGEFVSELKDYRGKQVLATSRPIAGTPWVLIVKIDRTEALSASGQRRAGMEVLFLMIIAIIVLIVTTTWWRAHSRRSLLQSAYFKKLAARALAQEQLLRLVADHQPEPIYIVDSKQVLRFANEKAAQEAHTDIDHVVGKSLADVRGAARAGKIFEQCEKALKQGQVGFDVQRVGANGHERVMRNAYVPLDHIPIVSLPVNTPGVLVVEQDISEVVHEREQRLDTQRQLIQTLVMLVDKRDPFAANHSQLVSQVAHEVAVEMELDNITVETTAIAGSLMNIGKIVVPTEVLTKTQSLTADEKRVIRESMNAAADVLKGIRFDGPVAETLRQWQEKWDGGGPLGLRGEQILVSARIIAVANAFIGMISPRSWRTAMAIEAANKMLLDQCDTHFDRRVVIAMINFVENHQGKAWIKQILEKQDVA